MIEVVGDTALGLAHILRQRTAAEVEIDGDGAAALDGEACGDVDCEEGLAAAWIERGEHDDLVGAVGTGDEVHVGADDTEGLVDHVAALRLDQDLLLLVLLFLLFLALKQGEQLAAGAELAILGNLADEGDGELVDVGAAAHLGVHVLTDEEDDQGDEQTQAQGHHTHVALEGGNGSVGTRG